MADIWDDNVLEKPNWKDHIQYFFSDGDIQCMSSRAIDLNSYYGVRLNADRIHFHTKRGSMPPQQARHWSEIKVRNFYNWMAAGYPEEESQFKIFSLKQPNGNRIRRSIREYESDPIALEKLKKAFRGMMEKPLNDPSGYYLLCSIHWLPAPALYCRHHENSYNPWHRAYLIAFEDAMREIDGCEDVTLPYWDIQDDYIPDFLWEEPFSTYEFKTDVKDFRGFIAAKNGDTTTRQPQDNLLDRVREYRDDLGLTLSDYIDQALGASEWQDFNGWTNSNNRRHNGIIMAHDLGHALCGTASVPGQVNRSLAVPNFAAFDPLFWFFHCNWDRLWWKWQKAVDATTLDKFTALAVSEDDPDDWISDPVVSMLQPFGVHAKDVINSSDWKIDYETYGSELQIQPFSFLHGSLGADKSIHVPNTDIVSIRVKGVNRLLIPGSFYLELLADDVVIGKNYIFQSDTPQFCLSCTKTGRFSLDFSVKINSIKNKELTVRVICLATSGLKVMTPEEFGAPKINIRLMLEQ